MKLIEVYNQAKLKEWVEYDLYVDMNGVEFPIDKYDRDTEGKKIVFHPQVLPRPRKKSQ
jgi:hypothetical protein